MAHPPTARPMVYAGAPPGASVVVVRPGGSVGIYPSQPQPHPPRPHQPYAVHHVSAPGVRPLHYPPQQAPYTPSMHAARPVAAHYIPQPQPHIRPGSMTPGPVYHQMMPRPATTTVGTPIAMMPVHPLQQPGTNPAFVVRTPSMVVPAQGGASGAAAGGMPVASAGPGAYRPMLIRPSTTGAGGMMMPSVTAAPPTSAAGLIATSAAATGTTIAGGTSQPGAAVMSPAVGRMPLPVVPLTSAGVGGGVRPVLIAAGPPSIIKPSRTKALQERPVPVIKLNAKINTLLSDFWGDDIDIARDGRVIDRSKLANGSNSSEKRQRLPKQNGIVVGIDFGNTFTGVSYAHQADGELIDIVKWPRHLNSYAKVPTASLYSTGDRTFVDWGSSALSLYKRAKEDRTLIRNYKLLLFDREAKGRLENGLHLTDVFTQYIQRVHRHVMDEINKSQVHAAESIPIHYCITVPQAWTLPTRELILRCYVEAGVILQTPAPNMTVITEAEAAATYCREKCDEFESLMDGDIFMVCDAGGLTTTITVFRVDDALGVRQFVRVSSAHAENCGSVILDRLFRDLVLRKLHGKLDLDAKPQRRNAFETLLERFGEIKAQFDAHSREEPKHISVPMGLEVREIQPPPEWLEDEYMTLKGEELCDEVFDPIVRKVKELIRTQTKVHPVCAGLFLVGGFGANKYLLHRLEQSRRTEPTTGPGGNKRESLSKPTTGATSLSSLTEMNGHVQQVYQHALEMENDPESIGVVKKVVMVPKAEMAVAKGAVIYGLKSASANNKPFLERFGGAFFTGTRCSPEPSTRARCHAAAGPVWTSTSISAARANNRIRLATESEDECETPLTATRVKGEKWEITQSLSLESAAKRPKFQTTIVTPSHEADDLASTTTMTVAMAEIPSKHIPEEIRRSYGRVGVLKKGSERERWLIERLLDPAIFQPLQNPSTEYQRRGDGWINVRHVVYEQLAMEFDAKQFPMASALPWQSASASSSSTNHTTSGRNGRVFEIGRNPIRCKIWNLKQSFLAAHALREQMMNMDPDTSDRLRRSFRSCRDRVAGNGSTDTNSGNNGRLEEDGVFSKCSDTHVKQVLKNFPYYEKLFSSWGLFWINTANEPWKIHPSNGTTSIYTPVKRATERIRQRPTRYIQGLSSRQKAEDWDDGDEAGQQEEMEEDAVGAGEFSGPAREVVVEIYDQGEGDEEEEEEEDVDDDEYVDPSLKRTNRRSIHSSLIPHLEPRPTAAPPLARTAATTDPRVVGETRQSVHQQQHSLAEGEQHVDAFVSRPASVRMHRENGRDPGLSGSTTRNPMIRAAQSPALALARARASTPASVPAAANKNGRWMEHKIRLRQMEIKMQERELDAQVKLKEIELKGKELEAQLKLKELEMREKELFVKLKEQEMVYLSNLGSTNNHLAYELAKTQVETGLAAEPENWQAVQRAQQR
ncbi:hypothetical protein BGZ73_004086 [Actinomortierella ambigua]|nr:hypothetical protein BGZ73_004086 [Actinomortierella ambigua]